MNAANSSLLDDDAHRAARVVAFALLERVREARPRLGDKKDVEALHDFRVAVRRLRSWLTLQSALLDRSAPPKVHRWLRRLVQATNPSRDDEVFTSWLAQERATLAAPQLAASDWLTRRVEQHRKRATATLMAAIDRDLDRACAVLDERLAYYAVPHHIVLGSRAVSFATELSSLVRTQAAVLRRRLRAVRGPEDTDAIHRARIAGKRLRYLLEPVESLVADGAACIAGLRTVQDLLGDHHDAHGWLATARDAEPRAPRVAIRDGVQVIIAHIEQRAAERYATLQETWFTQAPPLFEVLERLEAELAARGVRGVEIERKFLLNGLPSEMPGARTERIEQGYLPGARLIERIRRVRVGRRVQHLRTVKSGAGITRLEVEEPCSATVFAALWPLTEGRRVAKRRHLVANGALTWAIDEFTDRELVVAEVELPSVETALTIPAWLSAHVVREVTDDPAYVNAVLAR